MNHQVSTQSHWRMHPVPQFQSLSRDEDVEVLVIGGGMTGASAAYLLKAAGLVVGLIERERCGQQDTGNTTAHLTNVTDLRPSDLIRVHGTETARRVQEAGTIATDTIESIVLKEGIDCDFRRVPGYLHAGLIGLKREASDLRKEVNAARKIGYTADFTAKVPVFEKPGIRFENQAKFHSLKYLAGLLSKIPGSGSFVAENTPALTISREMHENKNEKITVSTPSATITCRYLVMASDVPLQGLTGSLGAAIMQSLMTIYTSYVIGAKVAGLANTELLFWDTGDPYFYLRIDARQDEPYAIFGGFDHKTGHTPDVKDPYAELERQLQRYLPQAKTDRRWSGQVLQSHDGLPIIGQSAPDQYVATGYSGNGITFGTFAALMIRDAIQKKPNAWEAVFSPYRFPSLRALPSYLLDNLSIPVQFVKDRLTSPKKISPQELAFGEGTNLVVDGARVAAYCDHQGEITVRSAVCPHLGCIVQWNAIESTWDCPCHGSRFKRKGELICGPAESNLREV